MRLRGINVTPGYFGQPDLTKKMFDEEGFYCIGDAGVFVDPADPLQGIIFAGRVVEDFKLMTGTFVHVGSLRTDAIAAATPVVQDALVAGQDRPFVGLLAWPNLHACRQIVGNPDATYEDVVRHPEVLACLKHGLEAHNKSSEGASSMRVARAMLMVEPASIDGNELTDKGYINQRAGLERRAALVETALCRFAGRRRDYFELTKRSEHQAVIPDGPSSDRSGIQRFASHRDSGFALRAPRNDRVKVPTMNFDFSDEQKQMRDEARKFLAEKCPPKAVRAVLDGNASYDKELWKGLAEMGFLGVAIPEEFGGAGAGHLELCVIAEEMGRALAPVPFSSTVYLAAEAILLAGSRRAEEEVASRHRLAVPRSARWRCSKARAIRRRKRSSSPPPAAASTASRSRCRTAPSPILPWSPPVPVRPAATAISRCSWST